MMNMARKTERMIRVADVGRREGRGIIVAFSSGFLRSRDDWTVWFAGTGVVLVEKLGLVRAHALEEDLDRDRFDCEDEIIETCRIVDGVSCDEKGVVRLGAERKVSEI